MKWFRDRNKASSDMVGCFGKLPLQAEFIKYNLATNQLINLEVWLQEAYQQICRDNISIKQKLLSTPLHHFFLVEENESLPLAGTVMPSKDKGGRVYPFLVYRQINNPWVQEFKSSSTILLADFYQASTKLCKSAWKDSALESLTSSVDVLSRPSEVLPRRQSLEAIVTSLKKYTLYDLWHGMTLNVSLSCFINSMMIAIEKFLILYSDKECIGLKIPLSSNIPSAVLVSMWMQIIESRLNQHNKRWLLIWNETFMTVYSRPMPKEYLKHFIETNQSADAIVDACNVLSDHRSHKLINMLDNLSSSTPLIELIAIMSESLKN